MFKLILIISVTTVIVAGCVNYAKPDSMLDYSANAKMKFDAAMEEFNDEDCVTADSMFSDIRRDFPYSSYAVLSELHIADCKFILGSHPESAILYGQFVKAHPTHKDAHYAAYKQGLSYYEMIPGNFFIAPPPYEKDLSAARDARYTFSRFLQTQTASQFREKANGLLIEVENLLVEHEIYVAKFYLKRNDQRAAAVRLHGIDEKFPNSTSIPDVMFLSAKTYLEMNDLETAIKIFNQIIEKFPEHYQTKRALDYLKAISTRKERKKDG